MADGKIRKIGSALIADDDGATRLGLLQFLRDRLNVGKTFEAHRFDDAMKLLAEHKIELAIFDLGIPGLKSAYDLAKVRAGWPGVRVVVLSASDKRRNILAALEAGAHGYIYKEATMDGLAKSLNHIMAGEIYVPPFLSDLTRGVEPDKLDTGDRATLGNNGSAKLTQRQRQVLRGIVDGKSNKQLASELELAIGTIKMHVSGVLTALGARSRSHAAALGRKLVD